MAAVSRRISWLSQKLELVARPKGFEPLTFAFGGQRSIQLSYGRFGPDLNEACPPRNGTLRSRDNAAWPSGQSPANSTSRAVSGLSGRASGSSTLK